MKPIAFLPFWVVLFALTNLNGQEEYSRWIVKANESNLHLLSPLKREHQVIEMKTIFKDLNLILIETSNAISKESLKKNILNKNTYLNVYPDINIELRRSPNDPDYPSQWGLNQIGMQEVWDITTGGKAPNGDDIVVAIFDDGYDITHIDYEQNIWVNTAEIEDNGIDDDNNGYIDDYLGWNATLDNDEHRVRSHGTAVAGIIGAVGDNGSLVAGVNWDVKLMLTSGGRNDNFSIADIIKAYEYIYTQRKIYNESGGTSGAYIVASNYSGGAPNLFPEDFPSWCEIYDLLGEQGVINFTSAPNSDVDVDIVGDLPSTCTSDYLIIVTNSDRQDNKSDFAGFGSQSVDIAAPGEEIITTGINSMLDTDFSGASASAPFVAGAVSLLYSVMCDEAYELSIQSPSEIVLIIRRILLQNVVPSSSLSGITTSGGRLDVKASIDAFRDEKEIGDCCSISLNSLDITNESCIDAGDGSINAEIDSQDVRGAAIYTINSSELDNSNTAGSFNFLPATTYNLTISAERDNTCRVDTSFSIIPSIDICSFGTFQIEKIGPNPNADNLLNIWYELDEAKKIEIVVFNSLGQIVQRKIIPANNNGSGTETIDISNLSMGKYYVGIRANDKLDTQSLLVIR